jgi:hypothetical protein
MYPFVYSRAKRCMARYTRGSMGNFHSELLPSDLRNPYMYGTIQIS